MTHITHWQRRFRACARLPHFLVHHSMIRTKQGVVFRTRLPFSGGCLFRNLFAVLNDGRIFGPRNREVSEAALVAWFEDEKGLSDVC